MSDKSLIPIRPVRKRLVTEDIVHEIKLLIDNGHLVPGTKLPPERQLSQMLNVSRPTLREALRALSLLGIIDNRPGSGSYLSISTSNWNLEPFSILFSIKRGTLLSIFEARKILDAGAAQLAATRRQEEDIKALEESLQGMQTNINDPEKYNRHELEFHMAIVEAAGNPVISDLIEKLYKMLTIAREEMSDFRTKSEAYRNQDYLGHKAILDAIKQGDGDAAARAMVDHLRAFEERLLMTTEEIQHESDN